MSGYLISRMRKLAVDRGGVAAMEFALLLPFMAALYFGAIEVSFLIQADRRVTNSTSVMADLAARLEEMDYCRVEEVFAATHQIMDPDDTGSLSMRLTSVVEDSEGASVVMWSQGRNMEAYPKSEPLDLPDGLMTSDGSLILAELDYRFNSSIGYFIEDTRNLTDQFFLRPRNSDEVVWIGSESPPTGGCGWEDDEAISALIDQPLDCVLGGAGLRCFLLTLVYLNIPRKVPLA